MQKLGGRESELAQLRRRLREAEEWRERMAGWLARAAELELKRVVSEQELADGSYQVVTRWPSKEVYLAVSQHWMTLKQMRELATFSADARGATPQTSIRA